MNSDAEPIEPHFTAAVNEHPILAITPPWQRYGVPAAVLVVGLLGTLWAYIIRPRIRCAASRRPLRLGTCSR